MIIPAYRVAILGLSMRRTLSGGKSLYLKFDVQTMDIIKLVFRVIAKIRWWCPVYRQRLLRSGLRQLANVILLFGLESANPSQTH